MPTRQSKQLASALLAYSVFLERFSETLIIRAQNQIAGLEKEVLTLITRTFPGGFVRYDRRKFQRLLKDIRDLVRGIYREIQDDLGENFTELAEESDKAFLLILLATAKVELKPGSAKPETVSNRAGIEGNSWRTWLERQAGDVNFRIAGSLRRAAGSRVGLGDTLEAIKAAGTFRGAQDNGRRMIWTATGSVNHEAQTETMNRNQELISALQQISVLDGRTTITCINYAYKRWRYPGLQPIGHELPYNNGTPRHFNCRSIIIPVLVGFDDVPEMNVDEWLESLPDDMQARLLGRGRMQLWRRGLTLQEMIDQTGRPMTLEEIRREFNLT
jgi:hypothetical protein